ncbi:15138_t:CDS:2, partial [Cetraspora pellucida]
IYTDGSYKDNQKGSYTRIRVYYKDRSKEITEPLHKNLQTNNYAELYEHRGVTENETAAKLARQGAAIKMNKSKKLSSYNAFMKTNLPIIKKNNLELDYKDAFKLVASM